jgi:hypothetical protein
LRLHALDREEVSRGWRKLRNQKIHNSYFSSDIIWMIKSRRMRWKVNFAHMDEKGNTHKDMVQIPKGKTPLDRKIILKLS